MHLNNNFHKVFGPKPILGMIHLAGDEPVKRALEEIEIFENEGVDGAIVENYHGTIEDVLKTLHVLKKRENQLVIGLNVLPNEYQLALPWAFKFGAKFIQLDYVSGRYVEGELPSEDYARVKTLFPDIIVLGGAHPKYFTPVVGSNLEEDLKLGMQRAEAIVVTDQGTGIETPLDKIMYFRKVLGPHLLIVGAGLTPENAYEQLIIGNGAIVGTTLKSDNDTHNKADRYRLRDFMDVVKQARRYKQQ